MPVLIMPHQYPSPPIPEREHTHWEADTASAQPERGEEELVLRAQSECGGKHVRSGTKSCECVQPTVRVVISFKWMA